MAAVTKTPATSNLPDFIQAINNDYKAQISHVFILHGNIYDFIDNRGSNTIIKDVLSVAYDDHQAKAATGTTAARTDSVSLTSANSRDSDKIRIAAFFSISHGLTFPNEVSREYWRKANMSILGNNLDEDNPGWDQPQSAGAFVMCMNQWFDVSKRMHQNNRRAVEEGKSLTKELIFTVVVY